MTGRLEEQTGALRAVNTQLDTRRAFIEAVLGSVTAGLSPSMRKTDILLINSSAEALLHKSQEQLEGQGLSELSRRTCRVHARRSKQRRCDRRRRQRPRTLAVNRVRYSDGTVLTFDDITDQLLISGGRPGLISRGASPTKSAIR